MNSAEADDPGGIALMDVLTKPLKTVGVDNDSISARCVEWAPDTGASSALVADDGVDRRPARQAAGCGRDDLA
jgi:hypothetical protein